MAITADYLEKNAKTLSCADFIFASTVKYIIAKTYTTHGFPEASSIVDEILSYKRAPDNIIMPNIPEWHDKWVLALFAWLSRHNEAIPMETKMAHVLAVETAAGPETASQIPLYSVLKKMKDLVTYVDTESPDPTKLKADMDFAVEMTLQLTPSNNGSKYVRSCFVRFHELNDDALFVFIGRLLHAAFEYYGPYCPDFHTYITSCVLTGTSCMRSESLNPICGQWLGVAHDACQYGRTYEEARRVDTFIRVAELTLWEEPRHVWWLADAVNSSLAASYLSHFAVSDCYYFFVSAALREKIPEEKIIDVIDGIENFCAEYNTALPQLRSIRITTGINRAVVDLYQDRVSQGMIKLRKVLLQAGRSAAREYIYVLRMYLPRIASKMARLYKSLNRPMDDHLFEIHVSSMSLLLWAYRLKHNDGATEIWRDFGFSAAQCVLVSIRLACGI